MVYLSKESALTAYKQLSKLTADPTAQGATQKVSALRYFLALDHFYKKYNRDCNTKNPSDKESFIDYVGEVVSILGQSYTSNFYYPLSKSDTNDYNCGSNFFSVNVVKLSKENPQTTYEFPRRGGHPLIDIKNGNLVRNTSYYKNLTHYLNGSEKEIVALAIWLIRELPFEKLDFENLKRKLSQRYTSDLVNILVQPKFQSLFTDYFKYSASRKDISDVDLRKVLEIKVQAENMNDVDSTHMPVNNDDIRDDYSIDELGKFLSEMMRDGKKAGIVVTCAAFGLKFGKAIVKNGYKPKDLIDAANKQGASIDHGQDGTINTGKSLYEAIDRKDFGLYFNDNVKWNGAKKTSLNSVLPFITALRTKPFLLLAGISGTGKSQKVQELAYMTCPGRLRGETAPGNYCLVEVKPNWHDSTELLGYFSALTGKYELTDFIRFVYKAAMNDDVPFFLCLDEMNLAPVEQYFAEYLSVLETRKRVGGKIKTQPLLKKEAFANCKLYRKEEEPGNPNMTSDEKHYESKPLYSEEDAKIINYLKDNGLSLPENLFIIGTVNMDDTTHQFSRKVIDRAFTIEMNGGSMAAMFSAESRGLLEYRDEPVSLGVFKPQFVRAYEVLDDERFAQYAGKIKTEIPALLGDSDGKADADSINGVLNNTPFRVSYRVQNELVLYLSTLIEQNSFPENIDGLIKEAVLAVLLEKVLPRVQGEKKQLETNEGKSNVLKDLKAFVARHFAPQDGDADELYDKVTGKLDEMDEKLGNYYTNFF